MLVPSLPYAPKDTTGWVRAHAGPPSVWYKDAVSRDPNTRLAYSTGGEQEPDRPELKPDKASAAKPASGKLAPGKPGSTRLRLDRRASGRVVTVVSGLPGNDKARAELGRELRAACGTGGTYKDGVLELQGDLRDRVEALLEARGIHSKRAGG